MSSGQGRAGVLLLHGLCSTPEELLPVQAALRAAGHEVRSPSLPGYSFDVSSQQQHATGWRDWLHQVTAQAAALREHHATVVLVGISAGASLALGTVMLGEVPIDGLALMSTPLRYDGWSVPWYQFLMPLALYTPLGRFWQYEERPPYGVKNPRVRRWIERELQSRRVSRAGAAVIGVAHLREHDRLRRELLRRLGHFDCPPVLALHAREDEVASLANVELLAQRLGSALVRRVVLENSHHMITIDNDRPQVVRETVSFVGGLLSPAPRSGERHRESAYV
ncbi:MAG: esterase [Rubrivivax sp. SCN 70-15]|nr:MAG: esterase [Rubrivivax sp. SCN 70-15]